MYEYLKAKSFPPVIFSFGPWFICIATLESEKALAWRSGTQQKEPFVFHHSNCSRSAFSGSAARGNTNKSEKDVFTFTPVYKKCFLTSVASHLGRPA